MGTAYRKQHVTVRARTLCRLAVLPRDRLDRQALLGVAGQQTSRLQAPQPNPAGGDPWELTNPLPGPMMAAASLCLARFARHRRENEIGGTGTPSAPPGWRRPRSRLRRTRRPQPARDAGASVVSTRPERGPVNMFSGPLHSCASINRVVPFVPPSAHAKQPRSRSIVASTCPPSRTRTQRLLGTSAYQRAFSASAQRLSGKPSPRSAHTRRFDRPPSASMSNAVSRLA
jgi:hypothetical protein